MLGYHHNEPLALLAYSLVKHRTASQQRLAAAVKSTYYIVYCRCSDT